jgi:hypothetical protein
MKLLLVCFCLLKVISLYVIIGYSRLYYHRLFFIILLVAIGGVATLPWEGVRMKLTLPKLGLGSLPRLLKFQSSITKVKKTCIGVLFISLKSY